MHDDYPSQLTILTNEITVIQDIVTTQDTVPVQDRLDASINDLRQDLKLLQDSRLGITDELFNIKERMPRVEERS